ncbi:hypothetical protein ACFY36_02920 [Actinoplanes sp. NPDC000266]
MRPDRLNAAIGGLFVVGSACFVVGSVPAYADAVGADADALTYFAGSIFFTSASFLQLMQARATGRRDRNWLAAVFQFPGTILFNVSTLVALVHNLSVQQQDRHVWRPDLVGSTLFIVASVFGVLAVGGAGASARDRWIAWLNMAGSAFFMTAALAAYVLPGSGEVLDIRVDLAGTLLGAVCFLVGAALLIPVHPLRRRSHDRPGRRRPVRQSIRHARSADPGVPGGRHDGPGRVPPRRRGPGPGG